MNITLKQLRVFCALYELRSFTAAARAAFVTQSAVSKLCAELEAEVGQPLFERSTRSITPCDGAADFYAYAQEILGTVRAAERSMSGLRSLERGRVGVATSPLMMVGLLGDVVVDYHRAHPSVALDLFELSTDDTIEHVRNGRADFGIVSLETPAQELSTRVIYRDTMFAVCATHHPLAGQEAVTWAEVAAQELIMLRNVYSVRRSLDRVAADLRLDFDYRIEAGMLTSVLKLVGAGLGITVVPGYARGLARELGLRVLDIDGARRHGHELWLIQRHNARLSMAASAFLHDTEQALRQREARED
ncbi:LysR family transcriptional regulator [Bordetella holmesii]|uniref:LysR substrate-binding domain protein n=2 Tax=Bordetella holmesii TaxID=35814 RepID=A0A158M5Y7_9BORD|nr:LysR family transcriptional regulator [Bordetella holmesii]AHV92771.1 bacterial regulatory helix-turn-helix, lysR family protein [Bordetella holmesii ATCC 51541]AIT25599.1 bacterial regulatory helix-turn-helix, lysR family protein [Bordetella holmesii 44057]EWM43787.1 bacterial regulatory helix-turn-helix, lysR family protein [Bordetella holmesii 41130]EWM46167.1 bacterial regulatory helix-turn-helix, lysR family protein [Bordetella holmesii 35009]EWM50322.1 bacterial regulatory helix-turn-